MCRLPALDLYRLEMQILKQERQLLNEREELAFQRFIERCEEDKRRECKADLHDAN